MKRLTRNLSQALKKVGGENEVEVIKIIVSLLEYIFYIVFAFWHANVNKIESKE